MNTYFQNKRLLLGIDNILDAHKCPQLASLLTAAGAQVKIILAPGAEKFVSLPALEAESGNRVHSALFPPEGYYDPPHLALSKWADAALIAPAGAELIAKLASGLADNLLTQILLHLDAPVLIAPALHPAALLHPAVKNNLKILQSYGYHLKLQQDLPQPIAEPSHFHAAAFHPAEILLWTADTLYSPEKDLEGVNILITAGPTVEEIDPVRYISNRSSGRMGIALAEEAAKRGALVTLIHGAINLPLPRNVDAIAVKSAAQMFEEVKLEFPRSRAAIMAAAVADFKPLLKNAEKIKKGQHLTLELTANPDILSWMGENRRKQFLVGFALENTLDINEARRKLETKKASLIVLNSIEALDSPDSKAVLVGHGFEESLPAQNKNRLAKSIIDQIAQALLR